MPAPLTSKLTLYTLRQLEYFVAAAEYGNTTVAADVLGVSQPSISMAIGHLEQIFSEQLFVRRRGKGLSLTPSGQRYFEKATKLIAQARSLGQLMDESVLSGVLQVGTFTTLGPMCIPPIARLMKQRHPMIELRPREGDLRSLRRQIEDGTLEIAVLYDVEGKRPNLVVDVLAKRKPYALLPKGHRLAQRRKVRLTELAKDPLIIIDLPHSRDYLMSPFLQRGISPNVSFWATSIEMCRGLVANGLGVSILVTEPASELSYDGLPVVHKPIADEIIPQQIVALYSRRVHTSPLAKAFLEVSREFFQEGVS